MREAFFVSFVRFYQQTFLGTFYMILLHLSIRTLTLEIHTFELLRYTFECNNWYKLQKSTKLGIFLILQDLKFTRAWTFHYGQKVCAWIYLRQVKRIVIDGFSVCSLYTKSFYHGLNVRLKCETNTRGTFINILF